MVPEPTASVVQTTIAGLSATVLTVTGVSFHGLLWGMLGAVVALMFASPQERGKALASVMCGMLCGAVMSDMLIALCMAALPALIVDKTANGLHLGFAFVIGGGAKKLFSLSIDWMAAKLTPKKSGGSDDRV